MQSDPIPASHVSRRRFLAASAGTALLLPRVAAFAAEDAGPFQATGVRVGEVDHRSAVIWTRLTQHPQRNNDGVDFTRRVDRQNPRTVDIPVEQIEGACPGAPGRVRVRISTREDLADATASPWKEVSADEDFTRKFPLSGFTPDTTYHYVTESANGDDDTIRSEVRGKFHTAPAATTPSDLRFCVMTCQDYPDRDHPDGHPIYPSMRALDPKFLVMTGDLVYYDNNEPRAVTPALARLHWERMFSLPRIVDMLRGTGTYWLKDDHDVLTNDCWPGMQAGELTFDEGLEIFQQQAPLLLDTPYRTFRWGRDVQVWFTDGRDFRSPNDMPDGPEKTIWGAEQKAWFQRTVLESDATWKVLVSPTPLVGPDRPGKNDNHTNAGFAHEGDELRAWLKEHAPDNFFVVCGDRHWQYHSVHPQTGLHEFSVGAASDSHAGGTPGENREYHRFHRVQGGFLSVELQAAADTSRIMFQLRNVDGGVEYEAEFGSG